MFENTFIAIPPHPIYHSMCLYEFLFTPTFYMVVHLKVCAVSESAF